MEWKQVCWIGISGILEGGCENLWGFNTAGLMQKKLFNGNLPELGLQNLSRIQKQKSEINTEQSTN